MGFSPQSRSRIISPRNRVKGSCGLATSFRIEALEIHLLSPLHGASKMRARHRPLFLERPETHLCDCNHAHSDAGRSVTGGDKVASSSLPAISDRPSPARVARA